MIEEKIKQNKKRKRRGFNYIFLFFSLSVYLLAILLSPKKIALLNKNIINLFIKIFPVLILIFVFMFILELFFPIKKMATLMKKQKDFVLWLVAVFTGILSTGSIYLWYPILKELKDNGVKDEIIAIFIFNRAIKLQLLPMMILYFGLKYVAILTLVMIFISVIYGFVFKLINDF